MKIVINRCFGGYELSYEAMMEYAKLKCIKLYAYYQRYNINISMEENPYIEYTGIGEKPYLLHYATKKIKNSNELNKYYFSENKIERTDIMLIRVVEKLGNKANGEHADLKIITIPDNIEYEITDYDGIETVEEKHRSWN